MEETRWLYITDFGYGSYALMKAKLVKETEKTYLIGKGTKEILISSEQYYSYIPLRLLKSNYKCFFDVIEAIDYVTERQAKYIHRLDNSMSKAYKSLDDLDKLRARLINE